MRKFVADKGKTDDRQRIRVCLNNGDLVHAFRQVSFDCGNRFADVVGGGVQICVWGKLGADTCVILLACSIDRLNVRHARYCAFDHTGDFGVHGLRRGAVKVGSNGNYRAINVR